MVVYLVDVVCCELEIDLLLVDVLWCDSVVVYVNVVLVLYGELVV